MFTIIIVESSRSSCSKRFEKYPDKSERWKSSLTNRPRATVHHPLFHSSWIERFLRLFPKCFAALSPLFSPRVKHDDTSTRVDRYISLNIGRFRFHFFFRDNNPPFIDDRIKRSDRYFRPNLSRLDRPRPNTCIAIDKSRYSPRTGTRVKIGGFP